MSSKLSNRSAVYTGVFDPVHLGHLDVIERGSRVFDRLIVGVGINPDKASFFSLEERVQLLLGLAEPTQHVCQEFVASVRTRSQCLSRNV